MALKCCFWTCAVLACSLLVLSEALPSTHSLYHRLQKRSGMRLCGRMLVETLATVCQNQYYGPGYNKRNYAYRAEKFPGWADEYPEGILQPQSALDFFNINQLPRNARGVADECCQKSCSYQQLISYCGPDPGK